MGYATARGVRIMAGTYSSQYVCWPAIIFDFTFLHVWAELDLPGHSIGLHRGAPALYANCSSASKLPDVSSERFFDFLDTIIAEMSELFPDNFLHMGGDEVNTECWEQDPGIVSWMHARNFR